MGANVRVLEYEVVDQLTAPGGAVREGLENLIAAALPVAYAECPVRTGRLQASIYGVIDEWPAEYGGIRGFLASDVHYARFVHDGTRYQDPNPFLARAMEAVT